MPDWNHLSSAMAVIKKFLIDPVLVIRQTCGHSAGQEADRKQPT